VEKVIGLVKDILNDKEIVSADRTNRKKDNGELPPFRII
jgi:hypothetical protein